MPTETKSSGFSKGQKGLHESAFYQEFCQGLAQPQENQELLKQVQKIIENVEQAEAVTELPNLKQLKTDGWYYRIRTGDYRIGLTIENDLVTFVRVLHRREIY